MKSLIHLTESRWLFVLSDVLCRMNLSVFNCQGQCFDGASNISDVRCDVATQLLSEKPHALYNHCYGHAINLTVGDTIKQVKLLKDILDTCFEISKLLKSSPKRDAAFEALKSQLVPSNPGFRTLCPTRWTAVATSLNSVISELQCLERILG